MWLSLILLLLILGITIRQAPQGVFGAFISAACTFCCVGGARGFQPSRTGSRASTR